MTEVRGGLREGSAVTASTIVETIESPNIWSEIERELEDVGISNTALEENRSYITQWLKTAIQNGMLEEMDPNMPDPNIDVPFSDSGYGGSAGTESYAPTLAPMSVANEEFETELKQHPSRTAMVERVESASTATSTAVKVRKASTVSTVLFKLLKKDTAIIEAASDGDLKRVAKLISSGANVNARDRWGWSALSMCGYGGFTDIARLLLDHGANMDNIDVDGDTPMDLATHRGHAGMVFLLEEERERRSMQAIEDDTEVPAS